MAKGNSIECSKCYEKLVDVGDFLWCLDCDARFDWIGGRPSFVGFLPPNFRWTAPQLDRMAVSLKELKNG